MNPSASMNLGCNLRLTGEITVLWISNEPTPRALIDALGPGCRFSACQPGDPINAANEGARAAVIDAGDGSIDIRTASRMLDELDHTHMVAAVIIPKDSGDWINLARRTGAFAVCPADAPAVAVAGCLAGLLQVQPAVRNLHLELSQVRTFGQDIGATFDQIDEEMRLAARLQRDFLPKKLPEVGDIRFATMFRPATWVSGDIYEVTRLDEDHVGFYVADAVGHGLPAALLTMFIKRALPTKRITADGYEIIPPDEAIAEVNTSICDQNLSSCQFCTAAYFIINCRTLELTYARGGHPPAVLLRHDGSSEELESSGGLLGVFPEETFDLGRLQLNPGDRIVLFSDGAEATLRGPGSSGRTELLDAIQKARHLDVQDMVMQLTGLIDHQQGSLHPEDDVTLLLMDIGQ